MVPELHIVSEPLQAPHLGFETAAHGESPRETESTDSGL
jgi:hypothetical protein